MNQKEKRLIAIIIVLALLAGAMGGLAFVKHIQLKDVRTQLAQALEQNTVAAPDADTAVNTEAAEGGAAAEFNGGIVTVEEAREEYSSIATYYYGIGMTEEEFSDDLKMTVLQTLVEDKIMRAKAEELGIAELSDEREAAIEAQANAEFEDDIAYYSQFRYDENKTEDQIREETIAFLAESGITLESKIEEARKGAWRDALYEYATKDAKLSDEALKEYYETQLISDEMTYSVSYAEYEADANAGRVMAWNPAGVRRVETILIPFDDSQAALYMNIQAELASGNTDNMDGLETLYEEIEPQANEVKERLNAGEDFAVLQARYGTLDQGGSYVSAMSTAYGDAFTDAVMALEQIGDTTEPIRVDRGIVIARYAADVQEGPARFEDIKDALSVSYDQLYKQDVYSNFVEKCIEEANVRYYPERI